jgi:hypothetical protein
MLLALALAVFAAGCGDSMRKPVDADIDAPADAPVDGPGGSALARNGLDPSPKDHDLELGVLAISVVVAGGPIGFRQRRRRMREP